MKVTGESYRWREGKYYGKTLHIIRIRGIMEMDNDTSTLRPGSQEATCNTSQGERRMDKRQEMREDARAAIIETLRDGYDRYYCDLHHEVFSTDYYIIGTHEAKKALEEYGVWDAIEKVQTYEKDNFGEIYTDLADPEKLINMLYYIIGEEVLYELVDSSETLEECWNYVASVETNAEILGELDA